ncbi:hypothetical protein QQ045_009208 [Rhodiola kirilowii]
MLFESTSNSKNDNTEINMDDFSDLSAGSVLLDSFDFDELFAGLDEEDSEMLPDLEILGDYYSISGTGDEQAGQSSDDAVSGSGSVSGLHTSSICSLSSEGVDVNKDGHSGKVKKKQASKKSRSGFDGKRKVKVDWTPELHKRFVQAVEQLGEKAVPSRILEIMATHGLTRHNIASHLQKYRSHRKHLIAREAETASWNQRRLGGIGKRVASPWLLPTIGFPSAMPQRPLHHRPLHVWGHPLQTNSIWPKHIVHPHHLQPRPVWAAPTSPYGPSQGTPCFPSPPQGFSAPPVHSIPHHALYKNDPRAATGQAAGVHPSFDSSPSNERIDAALEDVLAKPWLPLPIGLNPPAIDTVVRELQRQGVPQIPPS